VEPSVYDGLSTFINNKATSFTFGIPTDTTDTSTAVSSWNLFVAAMTQDQDLRSHIISSVHNAANLNGTFDVFYPTYDPMHGYLLTGAASPAQGAMLAPLALKAPVLAIHASGVSVGTRRAPAGTIVAAVTGSIAATLVVLVVFALARRRQRGQRRKSTEAFDLTEHNSLIVTPFEPISLLGAYAHNSSTNWTEEQQLLSGAPEAGIIPEDRDLSSAPPPVPFDPNLRPVAPITGGLSARTLRGYAQKAVMPNKPFPPCPRMNLSPHLLRLSLSSRAEQHRHSKL